MEGEKMERRLLTIGETAVYLGIAPQTIRNRVAPKSKRLFPVRPKRIGKLIRFDIRDLEKYVDTLDKQSNGD